MSFRTASCVLAAIAAIAPLAVAPGCGKKAAPPAPAPAPAPTPTGPKPPAPPPQLTAAQMSSIESDFAAARKLAAEAQLKLSEARELERTGGKNAANDTYVAAKKLFQKAVVSTEKWFEPELGSVSLAQINAYLKKYEDERGTWIRAQADMGKLNAK
ncbi:MAG: hypothetical protein HMLKMBBP_00392 [Planctomycetes bacterium]|nr:hypothetical protein [Planctomycetota bacterium]